jgi:hypothetical protein
MNRYSPYDCKGQDGKDNKQAFNRLPSFFQLFIKQTQAKIQKIVETENPGKRIVPTSGFRCHKVNDRWGGVDDSLHLFGLARDFSKRLCPDKPYVSPDSGLIVIDSGNCWHVQYKRG